MSLKIYSPEVEYFDNDLERFFNLEPTIMEFEISLFAISKWESITEKSYFANSKNLTNEEILLLIQCMAYDEYHFARYTEEVFLQLNDYMNKRHTATTISNQEPSSNKIITSEVVYGMMTSLRIPFECDKWNINRLMMLLGVVAENNNPKKNKMSTNNIYQQNAMLNAQRKAMMKTKG